MGNLRTLRTAELGSGRPDRAEAVTVKFQQKWSYFRQLYGDVGL